MHAAQHGRGQPRHTADVAEHHGHDHFALRVPAGGVEYRLLHVGHEDIEIGGGDARDHVWAMAGAVGGGGDDDLMHGGDGANLLSGNAGMDHLHGGGGADTLYGGADGDMLMGGPGDDLLDEGEGHSGVDGGPGNDTLIGGAGPDAFMVDRESGDDLIRDFTAGPGMFDTLGLRGMSWADLGFEDTEGGVRIVWDGGSVLLEGVWKADLAQDDFMFADSPDLPPGSAEPDGPTAQRATPSQPGPVIDGEDIRTENVGPGGITRSVHHGEVFIGRARADELEGADGHDDLIGRNGDDMLSGGGGDDSLHGDIGRDTLDGDDGMDRLDGGDHNDVLVGGAGEDELMGGAGDDVLDEGAGHGMLDGGHGDDTMTGGAGADAFLVDPDSGHDVVTDFEATGLAQGAFDHIALRHIRPDDVTVTDTADGALVAWDTDQDGRSDGSILLAGVARNDLRQSDFMFEEAPGFVADISTAGSWYVFA